MGNIDVARGRIRSQIVLSSAGGRHLKSLHFEIVQLILNSPNSIGDILLSFRPFILVLESGRISSFWKRNQTFLIVFIILTSLASILVTVYLSDF